MQRIVRWVAIAANVGWLVNVARFCLGNAQATGAAWEMDALGVGLAATLVFAVNAAPALLALVALTWSGIAQTK
jgi:predicted signal transduction protein with EAL and GGDEF domain